MSLELPGEDSPNQGTFATSTGAVSLKGAVTCDSGLTPGTRCEPRDMRMPALPSLPSTLVCAGSLDGCMCLISLSFTNFVWTSCLFVEQQHGHVDLLSSFFGKTEV